MRIPARSEIASDTPLRLAVAAAIAFPDGSMTAKGLKREFVRGRLAIARVAGKDYTTLADIDAMVQQCRATPKAPDSGSAPHAATQAARSPTPLPSSFSTDELKKARDAALTILQAPNKPSPRTSRRSTSRARTTANVIPLTSRSQT